MEPPPENIGEFIRHVKMQPVTIIGFGVNDPCCGIPTPLPPIGITPDGRQILAKNSLPEGPKRPILVQMGGCIPQFIAVMSDGTEISAEEIFSFQKNEMRPVLVQKISPGPLLALQSLNQPIRLAIQNQ
ncbi:hypothetical protein KKF32_02205 [Patescibacteria group bacterium]|nr:hypothetical protein [Patescibacteria group bacterium]